MRQGLVKIGAMLIVGVCLWAHASELFDRWDNTLQTGQDTESSMVLIASIVGAVLVFAKFASRLLRDLEIGFAPSIHAKDSVELPAAFPVLLNHSPPLPLKI